jgi:hypothetical protein
MEETVSGVHAAGNDSNLMGTFDSLGTGADHSEPVLVMDKPVRALVITPETCSFSASKPRQRKLLPLRPTRLKY